MKILLINHFPLTGSGSGVYTANLAKSLSKMGHEVAVIFPENISDYEVYNNIYLYPVFFKWHEIIDNQLDMNFPCFTTHPRSTLNFRDMNTSQRRLYTKTFKEKIEDIIKDFKPDVIHAQHLWTLAGISALLGRKYDIPLIVTCHGTDLIGIKEEISSNKNWGRKWALEAVKYASYIVTISNDNSNVTKELFHLDDSKIKFIKNGIDTNVFYKDNKINKEEVLESLNIDNKYKNIVTFVGKLTYVKGVETLIEAANIYGDDDTLTIIVGDGELRYDLEDYARRLKLENIVFIGNWPQSMLNKIYNISTCSIIPSRKEAFGLVAAEAMMCGIPVIASNQGGLPDFVTEDVGILFEIDNYQELANDIRDVIYGKRKFDSNMIAAKTFRLYSQDMLIKQFEDLYNSVIK